MGTISPLASIVVLLRSLIVDTHSAALIPLRTLNILVISLAHSIGLFDPLITAVRIIVGQTQTGH